MTARLLVEQRLGLPDCPLPGHRGVARIESDDSGVLRLSCCTGRWRSLGEVRAAVAYGTDALLTNIEIAAWTRRLAYEVEVFPLATVNMADISTMDVPDVLGLAEEDVRAAWAGFELLVGLRWSDMPPRAVAYSSRFCAAWTPIPTHVRAARAIRVLLGVGLLVRVGTVGGRTPLYVPRGYEGLAS